jgi:hypothetical protein
MTATLLDLAALEQRHPRLKGLASFWQRELAPALGQLEAERRGAMRVFQQRGLLALVGVAALVVGLMLVVPYGEGTVWALVGALVAGFAGYAWAFAPLGKLRKQAKAHLVGQVCRFSQLDYAADAAGFPFGAFEAANILPSHHRAQLEDGITGRVQGVPLAVCEARLIRRTRKPKGGYSNTTVFQGLLIATPLPGPPAAESILLMPDWGRIGNFLAGLGRRKRVTELALDPAFDRRYEVFASDAKAAGERLNPEVQACLLRLAELNEKTPSLALAGDQLLIVLPRRKNAFEGVSAFKPFDRPEPLETLLADLELLVAVVEALALPAAGEAAAAPA